MYEKVEVIVSGKDVEIFKFGAIEGWKIARKMLSVVSPALTQLQKGEEGLTAAVGLLFDRLSEKELLQLLKSLTSSCTIEGRKIQFDKDLGVNRFTIELVKKVIEVNFEEVFTLAQEAMGDLKSQTEVDSQERKPAEA